MGLWGNDTKTEEDISIYRYDNKNKVWLQKYKTEFCRRYAEKNPFIKQEQLRDAIQKPEDGQENNA